MKCYQNLTKKEKRPFVYITSPSSWAGLERPVGPAVVDSIIQCGLKCSHMGEECGAIQYHNMTQACTLVKVNILSWRPLNTLQRTILTSDGLSTTGELRSGQCWSLCVHTYQVLSWRSCHALGRIITIIFFSSFDKRREECTWTLESGNFQP